MIFLLAQVCYLIMNLSAGEKNLLRGKSRMLLQESSWENKIVWNWETWMQNVIGDTQRIMSVSYTHLHWDLVLVQTPEMGGGEIWFDDVLIRKDGMFVVDELKGLNPENLK